MPVTASCWVQARCITRRVCQRPVLEPTDLMDRGVSGTREEVGRPVGAWCRPAVSGDGRTKSARDDTSYCKAHGGGWRCQEAGCAKSAVTGGTPHCMAHGGGRRCRQADCFNLAVVRSVYCRLCVKDAPETAP